MIVDGFMFFNELELLEVRLHELEDVVDYHVLVESLTTHSGQPKSLAYYENRRDFAAFAHKIVHIVAELPGTHFTQHGGNTPAWRRENEQRDAIRRGLTMIDFGRAGDILMVSDADEIPSADAVRRYHPSMGVAALSQPVSYYWLNAPTAPWHGTRIVPHAIFERSRNLNDFRGLVETVIEPGGWHFSYLGGELRVEHKLKSFAHTELDTPEHIAKSFDAIEASSFREIDEMFPRYIRENRARFAHLIRSV